MTQNLQSDMSACFVEPVECVRCGGGPGTLELWFLNRACFPQTIEAAIQAVGKGDESSPGSLPPLPGQGRQRLLQRLSASPVTASALQPQQQLKQLFVQEEAPLH